LSLQLFDGDFVDEDLARLKSTGTSQSTLDLLNAFIDEVAGSDDALWKLVRRKESSWDPYFNCQAIEFFQNDGYNVYRLRPLATRLAEFRVLYALDAPREELHLLAIVRKRSPADNISPQTHLYAYEPSHHISVRVRSEYDSKDFARLP
jgi:hypothetical protein